jgi:hypothetical protein
MTTEPLVLTEPLTLVCESCLKPVIGRTGYVCLDPGNNAWHVFHRGPRCDPNSVGCYWFPTYRIGSAEDLLARTAFMLRQGWLGDTDWADFLFRILTSNGWNGRLLSGSGGRPDQSDYTQEEA